MGNYKIGDKFVMEIDEVIDGDFYNDDDVLYRIKGFNALVFDNYGLGKLKNVTSGYVCTKEEIEKLKIEAHKSGMMEAWIIIKSIIFDPERFESGIPSEKLVKIFGTSEPIEIIRTLNPITIKQRIIDYETEAKYLISESDGSHYGNIGDPTKMKDIRGESLFVGDVVTIISKENGINAGQKLVCESSSEFHGQHPFIMGIADCCKESGDVEDWIVIKEKSFTELENGEEIAGVVAVINKKN